MIDDLWYKNGVFYCLSVDEDRTGKAGHPA